MNTEMADGAAQRCVAQIGEALFGQPGMTLVEIAEKVKAKQPSPAGQGDALATLAGSWRARADKHELNALEADSIGDMPATVQDLETKCEVLREVAAQLEAALAARQPVECKYCDGSGSIHGTECGACQPVGQEPVALDAHGLRAIDFCIRDLKTMLSVAGDYDMDEQQVQSLTTAVETMELRKRWAAPPAQAVDLCVVRTALDAAEGLAAICASVDCYSREEVAASGREMQRQFAYARDLIDSSKAVQS